jgi:hypothetical protein
LIFEEGSEEPTGYLGPNDEVYRELTEEEYLFETGIESM